MKILSVDDSKTIRLIVKRTFSAYDCRVLEAANGEEGLALARTEKPDLIVLDITMPIMDGITMVTHLRTTPELKQIPVIMLTAESAKENIAYIASLGVRDYIIKPFQDTLLLDKAKRAIPLQLKSAAAAPSA